MTTSLGRDVDAPPGEWRFRVYRRGAPAALAELLPLLDHLGLQALDERPYTFRARRRAGLRLRHRRPRRRPASSSTTPRRREVQDAFAALVAGTVESDGFNRLVLLAGLTAARSTIVRAYAKYLRQIGFAFSQTYIEDTLRRHPRARRRPRRAVPRPLRPDAVRRRRRRRARTPRQAAVAARRRARSTPSRASTTTASAGRSSRSIDATVRTNSYRRPPGGRRSSSTRRRSPTCRCPARRHEIWVCWPRVEGVHLRGGDIARGGLRWSDRREDFRTEVLGLMKAQMVKNAVIVPTRRQGRLRRQAAAGGPRGDAGRGRRVLPGVHPRPARPHRQPRRRPADGRADDRRPPARHGRPRRRRPVPRRRRRQGHGDVQRHRQRDLRSSTASGSATRSPPAAAPATTTRRWASPPAARGRACAATPACSAQDADTRPADRRRHRRHVRRRVRQRDAAVAGAAARRRVRPPPRVPRPRPRPGGWRSPSAGGCSSCPARAGPTTTRRCISPGGGVYPRTPKSIELSDRGPRACSASPAGPLTPNELVSAVLRAPGRPAVERRHRHVRQGVDARRTPTSATGPTTACGSTAPSCAAGWSARAATSGSPSSAGSSTRWPAGSSTPTPSTTRPASTAATTRSTSRSCSTAIVDAGELTTDAAQRRCSRR